MPRVLPASDEAVAEAARLLDKGGLVVVPTHTNYNLVCDPEDVAAIRRVFAVKQRTKFGPLPLGIADPAAVDRYAEVPPWLDRAVLDRFWPGGVAFILRLRHPFPAELTCGAPTIAVGCTPHPVFAAVIGAAGGALAATSANRSGQGDIFVTLEKSLADLDAAVDLYIDGGPAWGARSPLPHRSATIVDATSTPMRLVRPGVVPLGTLREAIPELTVPDPHGPDPRGGP